MFKPYVLIFVGNDGEGENKETENKEVGATSVASSPSRIRKQTEDDAMSRDGTASQRSMQSIEVESIGYNSDQEDDDYIHIYNSEFSFATDSCNTSDRMNSRGPLWGSSKQSLTSLLETLHEDDMEGSKCGAIRQDSSTDDALCLKENRELSDYDIIDYKDVNEARAEAVLREDVLARRNEVTSSRSDGTTAMSYSTFVPNLDTNENQSSAKIYDSSTSDQERRLDSLGKDKLAHERIEVNEDINSAGNDAKEEDTVAQKKIDDECVFDRIETLREQPTEHKAKEGMNKDIVNDKMVSCYDSNDVQNTYLENIVPENLVEEDFYEEALHLNMKEYSCDECPFEKEHNSEEEGVMGFLRLNSYQKIDQNHIKEAIPKEIFESEENTTYLMPLQTFEIECIEQSADACEENDGNNIDQSIIKEAIPREIFESEENTTYLMPLQTFEIECIEQPTDVCKENDGNKIYQSIIKKDIPKERFGSEENSTYLMPLQTFEIECIEQLTDTCEENDGNNIDQSIIKEAIPREIFENEENTTYLMPLQTFEIECIEQPTDVCKENDGNKIYQSIIKKDIPKERFGSEENSTYLMPLQTFEIKCIEQLTDACEENDGNNIDQSIIKEAIPREIFENEENTTYLMPLQTFEIECIEQPTDVCKENDGNKIYQSIIKKDIPKERFGSEENSTYLMPLQTFEIKCIEQLTDACEENDGNNIDQSIIKEAIPREIFENEENTTYLMPLQTFEIECIEQPTDVCKENDGKNNNLEGTTEYSKENEMALSIVQDEIVDQKCLKMEDNIEKLSLCKDREEGTSKSSLYAGKDESMTRIKSNGTVADPEFCRDEKDNEIESKNKNLTHIMKEGTIDTLNLNQLSVNESNPSVTAEYYANDVIRTSISGENTSETLTSTCKMIDMAREDIFFGNCFPGEVKLARIVNESQDTDETGCETIINKKAPFEIENNTDLSELVDASIVDKNIHRNPIETFSNRKPGDKNIFGKRSCHDALDLEYLVMGSSPSSVESPYRDKIKMEADNPYTTNRASNLFIKDSKNIEVYQKEYEESETSYKEYKAVKRQNESEDDREEHEPKKVANYNEEMRKRNAYQHKVSEFGDGGKIDTASINEKSGKIEEDRQKYEEIKECTTQEEVKDDENLANAALIGSAISQNLQKVPRLQPFEKGDCMTERAVGDKLLECYVDSNLQRKLKDQHNYEERTSKEYSMEGVCGTKLVRMDCNKVALSETDKIECEEILPIECADDGIFEVSPPKKSRIPSCCKTDQNDINSPQQGTSFESRNESIAEDFVTVENLIKNENENISLRMFAMDVKSIASVAGNLMAENKVEHPMQSDNKDLKNAFKQDENSCKGAHTKNCADEICRSGNLNELALEEHRKESMEDCGEIRKALLSDEASCNTHKSPMLSTVKVDKDDSMNRVFRQTYNELTVEEYLEENSHQHSSKLKSNNVNQFEDSCENVAIETEQNFRYNSMQKGLPENSNKDETRTLDIESFPSLQKIQSAMTYVNVEKMDKVESQKGRNALERYSEENNAKLKSNALISEVNAKSKVTPEEVAYISKIEDNIKSAKDRDSEAFEMDRNATPFDKAENNCTEEMLRVDSEEETTIEDYLNDNSGIAERQMSNVFNNLESLTLEEDQCYVDDTTERIDHEDDVTVEEYLNHFSQFCQATSTKIDFGPTEEKPSAKQNIIVNEYFYKDSDQKSEILVEEEVLNDKRTAASSGTLVEAASDIGSFIKSNLDCENDRSLEERKIIENTTDHVRKESSFEKLKQEGDEKIVDTGAISDSSFNNKLLLKESINTAEETKVTAENVLASSLGNAKSADISHEDMSNVCSSNSVIAHQSPEKQLDHDIALASQNIENAQEDGIKEESKSSSLFEMGREFFASLFGITVNNGTAEETNKEAEKKDEFNEITEIAVSEEDKRSIDSKYEDQMTVENEENGKMDSESKDQITIEGNEERPMDSESEDQTTLEENEKMPMDSESEDQITVEENEKMPMDSESEDQITIGNEENEKIVMDSESKDHITIEGNEERPLDSESEDQITVEGNEKRSMDSESEDQITIGNEENDKRSMDSESEDQITVEENEKRSMDSESEDQITIGNEENDKRLMDSESEDQITVEENEKMPMDSESEDQITIGNEENEKIVMDSESKDHITIEGNEERPMDSESEDQITVEENKKMPMDSESEDQITVEENDKRSMDSESKDHITVEENEKRSMDSESEDQITVGNEENEKIVMDSESEDQITVEEDEKIVMDSGSEDQITVEENEKIAMDSEREDQITVEGDEKIVIDSESEDQIIVENEESEKIVMDSESEDQIIVENEESEKIVMDSESEDQITLENKENENIMEFVENEEFEMQTENKIQRIGSLKNVNESRQEAAICSKDETVFSENSPYSWLESNCDSANILQVYNNGNVLENFGDEVKVTSMLNFPLDTLSATSKFDEYGKEDENRDIENNELRQRTEAAQVKDTVNENFELNYMISMGEARCDKEELMKNGQPLPSHDERDIKQRFEPYLEADDVNSDAVKAKEEQDDSKAEKVTNNAIIFKENNDSYSEIADKISADFYPETQFLPTMPTLKENKIQQTVLDGEYTEPNHELELSMWPKRNDTAESIENPIRRTIREFNPGNKDDNYGGMLKEEEKLEHYQTPEAIEGNAAGNEKRCNEMKSDGQGGSPYDSEETPDFRVIVEEEKIKEQEIMGKKPNEGKVYKENHADVTNTCNGTERKTNSKEDGHTPRKNLASGPELFDANGIRHNKDGVNHSKDNDIILKDPAFEDLGDDWRDCSVSANVSLELNDLYGSLSSKSENRLALNTNETDEKYSKDNDIVVNSEQKLGAIKQRNSIDTHKEVLKISVTDGKNRAGISQLLVLLIRRKGYTVEAVNTKCVSYLITPVDETSETFSYLQPIDESVKSGDINSNVKRFEKGTRLSSSFYHIPPCSYSPKDKEALKRVACRIQIKGQCNRNFKLFLLYISQELRLAFKATYKFSLLRI